VVDGTELYRWPVSTGTRGHETPSGVFRPTRIERHWYSRQYQLTPMPWAAFFHRGYAVHGTMEAYSLGHAASHGCVRLRPDKAAILFALVRKRGLDSVKVSVTEGSAAAAAGAGSDADGNRRRRADRNARRYAFAKALSDIDQMDLSAKGHPPANATEERKPAKRAAERAKDGVVYRVSAGDDAKVLREREAWLRSLDRKYGSRGNVNLRSSCPVLCRASTSLGIKRRI
jgi:L,D-transpeptidase-like protein